MNQLALTVEMNDPQQGYEALVKLIWPHLKSNLIAGRRMVATVEPYEDAKTDEQRGYYHGVVLEHIAEHGRANGQQFPMPMWKEYFRAKYLGFKVRTYRDPMTGKKVRRRERISTEDLGVKGYANLIDKVIAFASVDLGLTIPEPVKPLPKPSRGKEVIDADTGEILEGA